MTLLHTRVVRRYLRTKNRQEFDSKTRLYESSAMEESDYLSYQFRRLLLNETNWRRSKTDRAKISARLWQYITQFAIRRWLLVLSRALIASRDDDSISCIYKILELTVLCDRLYADNVTLELTSRRLIMSEWWNSMSMTEIPSDYERKITSTSRSPSCTCSSFSLQKRETKSRRRK